MDIDAASPNLPTQETPKASQNQPQTPPPPPPPAQPATTIASADPSFPAVSVNDGGLGRRPRDGRILHMLLANMGVTSYSERVPLQMMDFAYRHTSSILQDAVHFASEAYNSSGTAANKANNDAVTVTSIRLAVGSRTHYQFSPGLPKEQLQEIAAEKNRIALPPMPPDRTLRLPPERYVLTGAGYGLKDEWDSEGEEDVVNGDDQVDQIMAGDNEGGEEEDERMEDLFGESFGGRNEDQEMEDS